MTAGRTVLAALLCLAGGCLTPPVLIAPERVEPERVAELLPERAERVELALDERTTLRGWYVPADAGAPLVLHLLESGASADSPRSSRILLARQLADLGFASLWLDSAGIGSSSGKASARNLARDARAMWEEALRRVDGRPERVVLRATSLGTIAAWTLVAGGAEPAGVILLVPVMPHTVTRRFARAFYGRAAGWVAAALYRDVVDVEPLEVIEAAALPWLVVQAEHDQLTSAAERDALEHAVIARGGRATRLPHDHIVAAALLSELSTPELWFLTEAVPGRRDLQARSEVDWVDPHLPRPPGVRQEFLRMFEFAHDPRQERIEAAHAAQNTALTGARLRWLLARRPLGQPDPEALGAFFDLRDPAGELPIDLLERVSLPLDVSERMAGMYWGFDAETIAAAARAGAVGRAGLRYTTSVEVGGIRASLEVDHGDVFHALVERGLEAQAARRQFARLLLKAYRIPERVVTANVHPPRLEARVEGTWVELDLTSPHDPASFDAGLNLRGTLRRSGAPTPP